MSLSEEQIKTALAAAVNPNTGKDFVAGKSLKNIKFDGNDVSFDIELGYPAKTQFDGIRKQVLAAVRACAGCRQRVGQRLFEDRRPFGPDGRQAGAGRQEHHRRRIRQGRRRQEHDRRQSRAGPGPGRRQRRHSGCRHLRPVAAANARAGRPATGIEGRREHGTAGSLWPAGDVDRFHGRCRDADGLARPDGGPGARPVDQPDQLARCRLPDRRYAAGYRRHPAVAGPEGAGDRRGDRHDAAGHRADRCAQGPQDVREGQYSRSSASSRT